VRGSGWKEGSTSFRGIWFPGESERVARAAYDDLSVVPIQGEAGRLARSSSDAAAHVQLFWDTKHGCSF